MMRRQRALTLVELMIVVAVLAVVALLAAPSLNDFILVQRLKSINAQLVTDLQYARSEAVSRNLSVRLIFREQLAANPRGTCYVLFASTSGVNCDCSVGGGGSCPAGVAEIRTVTVPLSSGVTVRAVTVSSGPGVTFDSVNGSIQSLPSDAGIVALATFVVETAIDTSRTLRTTVGATGRVTNCSVGGGLGAAAC